MPRRGGARAIAAGVLAALALTGALGDAAGHAQSAPLAGNPPAAQPAAGPATAPVEVYDARIVARIPHDTAAFTEGLVWHDGAIYESTGLVGRSDVRKLDAATGQVLAHHAIPAGEFGEGLALWGDELISLTWHDGIIHRWRVGDLAPLGSQAGYPFEGWGLARLDHGLIASDGSSTLRVMDPGTFAVRRTVQVTLGGRPVPMLNELEVVDGLVLANVWMTDFILAIDPGSGAVRQVIDLRGLAPDGLANGDAVLNGIAWDEKTRRLFVTGKLWPEIYQIELVRRGG